MVLPDANGGDARAYLGLREGAHLLTFNPDRRRWELAEKPGTFLPPDDARVMAVAPDGRGGVWVAYSTGTSSDSRWGTADTYFYNYSTAPPEEVFGEVSNPLADGERLTDLAGTPDGAVWVSTDGPALYRYDRLLGWERARIPGWDPGRVVIRRTPVNALALAADGSGVAVGDGGKIATISPSQVALDAAAGKVCESPSPNPPCGTSFDLRSAAVPPDGSALVGGEARALLWRPAGGDFRKVEPPDAPTFATITGIAMPHPGRAWLALDSGQVFAGSREGGDWAWRLENETEIGTRDGLLSEDSLGEPIPLRAIAIDAEGHGYAVGDQGLVLERTADGASPWRRVDVDVTEELTAVALPSGEGDGALIGGNRGLVLTLVGGEWQVARPGDRLRPDDGYVAGLAMLPGYQAGEIEAWSGVAPQPRETRSNTSQLLHYASDTAGPLLDAEARAAPLRDAPPPREGELSFAAFGRSDCHVVLLELACPPFTHGSEANELILRRVRDAILERSRKSSGPLFGIYTGDAYDTAGPAANEPVEQNSPPVDELSRFAPTFGLPNASGASKYRSLSEQLLDPLANDGLPVFGAIGSRDLSETRACAFLLATVQCAANRELARGGDNLAWRQGMEEQPAPWGEGDEAEAGTIAFEAVSRDGLAVRHEDQEAELGDALGDSTPVEDAQLPLGGASTHYAFDVVDTAQDKALARVVFVDTSLGSLSAADPIQQPLEPDGQLAWLDRMTCIVGSAADTGQCSRERGQRAIVVSNTPTYAYGGIPPTETQLDGTAFEQFILKNQVDVVVSGRLGWNGLYWTRAPGVHFPDPNGDYPAEAPESLPGQGAPVPFVVASSAGGRFNGQATSLSASNGFWRGYTIVRLHPSGDPGKTVVEQRPIFDWIRVTARDHAVEARQNLRLEGVGREPIGSFSGSNALSGSGRLDEIVNPAITHRYDLLLADPEEPWVPCEAVDERCRSLHARLSFNLSSRAEASRSDAGAEGSQSASATSASLGDESPCAPYLCLPERIGTVDSQAREVKAGNGKYPDTFAVAILSVGDHVATYPLVFKKSPSFVAEPLRLAPPAPAPPSVAPNSPQPPQPPSPPKPNVPQTSIPEVPPPPPVPPIAASEPPEPQPPTPPAPPPPTEQLSPLDLTINPASLTVSTPAAVIQPPTPPVNPAPPSGARREARQRQAATQKSGADSDATSEGESHQGDHTRASAGDLGMTRHNHSFARHASAGAASGPNRAHIAAPARFAHGREWRQPSFTALPRSDPSASAQALLYGGGITIAALALALSFTGVRPTPRRRSPEVPAPALARARRWR